MTEKEMKEVNPRKLRARDDKVLLHRAVVTQRGGIAVPQTSAEAWRWTVLNMGSEVKDLKPGEEVWIAGIENQDYARIPNEVDLYIVHQRAIHGVVGDPEYTRQSEKQPANAHELFNKLSN